MKHCDKCWHCVGMSNPPSYVYTNKNCPCHKEKFPIGNGSGVITEEQLDAAMRAVTKGNDPIEKIVSLVDGWLCDFIEEKLSCMDIEELLRDELKEYGDIREREGKRKGKEFPGELGVKSSEN